METLAAPVGSAEAFADRLLQATLSTMDMFSIYLGVRLNYYRALAHGPLTAAELAARTGTDARYTREWLEQQAVAKLLEVDDAAAPEAQRRFALPAAQAEVLTREDSAHYLAPLALLMAGIVHPLPALLNAYRHGSGVAFAAYGPDLRDGQAAQNRTLFLQQLGQEWLPGIADIHARLQGSPPARVADVGCGAAWSGIGMAQSYPTVYVDGYDLDADSVALAQANVAAAGLSDRVHVALRDAAEAPLDGGCYDLVTAFECIHDMAQPVAVLQAMRRLAGSHGAVLVMDERVAETFDPAQADDIERLMYGFSILHCLPVGRADAPSAETGTVMRPATLARYAQQAGFSRTEILPIEHPFFRLYRLYN
ncbi:class I SAM-dependent methyltransferase [Hymenobacter busanensis]|uniref:Class I SAM-dependent methyltransferase n=1 Tax=Hymenobacter busanensis TaxID=2607656 RepID=A0A7L5A2R5_9BACT|nr:class I SAM-dependent methyltransferase [Hymenobacter busanensis]KAA9327032.1 class I SAM-dependent methyltransferase [Hymenobacter busanensis]QHJ09483.1 methyltransferase domain-containing protein [Hymenobacter busanensis]